MIYCTRPKLAVHVIQNQQAILIGDYKSELKCHEPQPSFLKELTVVQSAQYTPE